MSDPLPMFPVSVIPISIPRHTCGLTVTVPYSQLSEEQRTQVWFMGPGHRTMSRTSGHPLHMEEEVLHVSTRELEASHTGGPQKWSVSYSLFPVMPSALPGAADCIVSPPKFTSFLELQNALSGNGITRDVIS